MLITAAWQSKPLETLQEVGLALATRVHNCRTLRVCLEIGNDADLRIHAPKTAFHEDGGTLPTTPRRTAASRGYDYVEIMLPARRPGRAGVHSTAGRWSSRPNCRE